MEHIRLAREILSFYYVTNPHIEFIRHNENITFKITDRLNGNKYLLRIHSPITEGFIGTQNSLDGLTSEMILLSELNCNHVLPVQEPIKNVSGNYVTVYYSSNNPSTYYATLLVWIEGATLTLETRNIDEIVFELGESLAVFHEFTRHTKSIKELIRPVYDSARIDTAIAELHYGVEAGLYSEEQYRTIIEVLVVVKGQIQELNIREASWGLIHADLQFGNIVICDGKPRIIDFGFSGFGYYLFDLGSASSFLPSELRNTLLKGYATKNSSIFNDIRYIEGLIFMDIFISYVIFMRDSNNNGWIKSNAAKICDTLCKDFLAGTEVYYSF